MAKIKTYKGVGNQFGGFSPFGNVTALNYTYATNAKGVVIGSDATAPVAINDTIYVGTAPQGFAFHNIYGTGVKVGFEYVDGVDSTELPQNANINAALLVPLPKDAHIYVTASAAASSKVEFRFALVGELKGPK